MVYRIVSRIIAEKLDRLVSLYFCAICDAGHFLENFYQYMVYNISIIFYNNYNYKNTYKNVKNIRIKKIKFE